MKNEEAIKAFEKAIKALQDMISEGWTNCQWDFIDEIKLAIKLLETQAPKNILYEPVCKFGYADCIYDPAYIKYVDSEWYTELYGDAHPNEVNDCQYCKNGSRYDDEDK